ncbi:YcfL family protein [Campylobacter sp. VicNov18]|uniref:YcfL family protein n=1 Tax=Campylobacter bilis TaxID=2691918 RepID=UPI00130E2D90|nr:YcfL family protein [Campylobacter bilis]MPV63053.1 hypothetical protein [Campylobacter hepaticus]MBM0636552.1 hypothetical protein [Campylobacter bilis]MCC8277262.1 YcfL family protein [Campylobacter bilis]MCC8299005.1 YcfL family protein [Campylobacter bilis]MCC8300171.1 YcfL family protein [Campylobacter bilis]
MKNIILSILLLLLNACASSQSIKSNVNSVEILDTNLPKSLVKSFQKRVNDNGFLELEIILKSSFTKDIIYKIDCLDKDGFVLKDSINEDYKVLRIPAGKEVILRKLAFDKRTKDFKIELKTKN